MAVDVNTKNTCNYWHHLIPQRMSDLAPVSVAPSTSRSNACDYLLESMATDGLRS